MNKEFIVNRNGKDFMLYAGLLDQAHSEGLKRISTSISQFPNADNQYQCICWALVVTAKGEFAGLGEASPQSVKPHMVKYIVQLAETRAKARALRDAINVGAACLEELAGDDEAESVPADPSIAARDAAYAAYAGYHEAACAKTGIAFVLHDVRDQRGAETALAQLKEQYREATGEPAATTYEKQVITELCDQAKMPRPTVQLSRIGAKALIKQLSAQTAAKARPMAGAIP